MRLDEGKKVKLSGEEQEDILDLLDLITTLVKLNLFFSTTVTMQVIFQSSTTSVYTPHHLIYKIAHE